MPACPPEVVTRVIELRQRGPSLAAISNTLNAEGVPTRPDGHALLPSRPRTIRQSRVAAVISTACPQRNHWILRYFPREYPSDSERYGISAGFGICARRGAGQDACQQVTEVLPVGAG
ncbi:hypothetical protein GCM10009527_076850 [Actinomadura nitritigenes]